MLIVALGAVQFPLYQLLAPWKEITVATCEDTRYMRHVLGTRMCDFNYRFKELGYTQIGIDLEPAQMAVIPARYILPRIKNDLATLHRDQVQSHIWKEPLSYGDTTIGYEGLRGFVAALPGRATTGVLREHIMRLNSLVSTSPTSPPRALARTLSKLLSSTKASTAGVGRMRTSLLSTSALLEIWESTRGL
jgi:hypothetical protein